MSVQWGNEQILPFNKREITARVGENAKTKVIHTPLSSDKPYPVQVKNRINGGTRTRKRNKRKTRKH